MQHWYQFCRRCGVRLAEAAAPPTQPAPPSRPPSSTAAAPTPRPPSIAEGAAGRPSSAPYVPPDEYTRAPGAPRAEEAPTTAPGGTLLPQEPEPEPVPVPEPEPEPVPAPAEQGVRVTFRVLDAKTRQPIDAVGLGLRLRGRRLHANAEGTLFEYMRPEEARRLKGADLAFDDVTVEHLPWSFTLSETRPGVEHLATLIASRRSPAEAVPDAPRVAETATVRCATCAYAGFPWQRFCGSCGALMKRSAPPVEPPETVQDGGRCTACGLASVEGYRYCTGCGAFRPQASRPR